MILFTLLCTAVVAVTAKPAPQVGYTVLYHNNPAGYYQAPVYYPTASQFSAHPAANQIYTYPDVVSADGSVHNSATTTGEEQPTPTFYDGILTGRQTKGGTTAGATTAGAFNPLNPFASLFNKQDSGLFGGGGLQPPATLGTTAAATTTNTFNPFGNLFGNPGLFGAILPPALLQPTPGIFPVVPPLFNPAGNKFPFGPFVLPPAPLG